MELTQAIVSAKKQISNILANARVQADLARGEGYTLKPVQRASRNGGTYFNLAVVDSEGNKVGGEVEVCNFNPSRTRAFFLRFENIIIKDIHSVVANDILKKMDEANGVSDVADFEFEVFEAPAPAAEPAKSAGPAQAIAF